MELVEQVQEWCRRMVDNDLWSARIGIGSLLSLDIGPSHEDARGVARGDVHLWIEHGDWRLLDGPQLVAHCEDEHDTMQRAVDQLVGGTVTACTLRAPDDLTLVVDDHLLLSVVARRDPEIEDWHLFVDELVVTADAGTLVVEDAPGS